MAEWWETARQGDFYKEARKTQDWAETARRIMGMGMITPGSYWLAPEYYTIQEEINRMIPALKGVYDREDAIAANQGEIDRINAEIANLNTIMASFTGAGDDITRWLIGNNIARLQHEKSRINTSQDRLIHEAGAMKEEIKSSLSAPKGLRTGPSGQRLWEGLEERALRGLKETEREVGEYEAPTKLPIPDWMQQYLEPSISGLEKRPKGITEEKAEEIPWAERQAFALRPLGAQAETTGPELEALAGRLGWGRAGAPMYFSEEYVEALKGLPAWWEEYITQAEKLFPSAVRMRKPTWRTATQW